MPDFLLPDTFELMNRPRRLRRNPSLRALFREHHLCVDDLIYPIFLEEGENIKTAIPSLAGQYRWSVDRLDELARQIEDVGVRAVLLFGIPKHKDAMGSEAHNPEGPVAQGIRKLRELLPELVIIADVCLCEYTDHGHCGYLDGERILNDASLRGLARAALCYAEAGADMVAPSAMMDGQVRMLREALDLNGFIDCGVMAYGSKTASAFYGPFRDAAGSAPRFGDRKSYQMDPANGREALRENFLDLDEGADVLLVKPALVNLDILRELREQTVAPLAVYLVSGEYAMLKCAGANGLLDAERSLLEAHLSCKRAGADLIITYAALELAAFLQRHDD